MRGIRKQARQLLRTGRSSGANGWRNGSCPSTYAFREAVFNTPNLVGVFTGHIHRLMVGQAGNALLFSVPSNRDGSCMEVRLSPS